MTPATAQRSTRRTVTRRDFDREAWAREKEQKKEGMAKTVHALIDRLNDPVQAPARMVEFCRWMARFHSYSFYNQCLILSQFPDATRVAGFNTWRDQGRCVRKGEKGIAILVPFGGKAKVQTQEGEEETALPTRHFGIGHVFDVSQTEGEEVPDWRRDLGEGSREVYDACLRLVAADGIRFEQGAIWGGAAGYAAPGEIKVDINSPLGARVQTLVHEITHHRLGHVGTDTDRPLGEGEAELVTCVVMQAFGYNIAEDSIAYTKTHGAPTQTLLANLSRISKCAHSIIEDVHDQLAEETP